MELSLAPVSSSAGTCTAGIAAGGVEAPGMDGRLLPNNAGSKPMSIRIVGPRCASASGPLSVIAGVAGDDAVAGCAGIDNPDGKPHSTMGIRNQSPSFAASEAEKAET